MYMGTYTDMCDGVQMYRSVYMRMHVYACALTRVVGTDVYMAMRV